MSINLDGFGTLFDHVVECQVLGAVLHDRDLVPELLALDRDAHFTDLEARLIFNAIRDLDADGVVPDALATRSRLISSPLYASKDPKGEYLARCLALDLGASNEAAHAFALLRFYRTKRELVRAIGETQAAVASSPVEMIETTVADAQARLSVLGEPARSTVFDVGSLAAEVILAAERAQRVPEQRDRMVTGIDGIDNVIGQIERQSLVVIAARPSHGKTALGGTIAYNAARAGKRILIYSLEVRAAKLAMSLLAKAASVDSRKLRDGSLSQDEWARVMRGGAELKALDITIDEQAAISVQTIRARAKVMNARKPIDAIFIDYLQLVEAKDAETRERAVAIMSRAMKILARELDTRVFLLAQMNRKVDESERLPRLSDIRESGAIEQDADQAWLVHYPYRVNSSAPKNETVVLIEKNRDGPTAKVELGFEPHTQTVRDRFNTPEARQRWSPC